MEALKGEAKLKIIIIKQGLWGQALEGDIGTSTFLLLSILHKPIPVTIPPATWPHHDVKPCPWAQSEIVSQTIFLLGEYVRSHLKAPFLPALLRVTPCCKLSVASASQRREYHSSVGFFSLSLEFSVFFLVVYFTPCSSSELPQHTNSVLS